MLFNSLTYILFMLALVPMVVFGPKWLRNTVLLLGSLTFYAFWRVDFLALIVLSAFIDWYGGLQIEKSDNARVRKTWLAVSMTMNLLILGFFKYTYFVLGTTNTIFEAMGVETNLKLPEGLHILLPLGISFYTFESMSYTIDVYRRVTPTVPNFLTFLTFVMLWPKLVAGPIFRTSEVVPQLDNYQRPKRGEVMYGLEEILQGLFKKLVLADSIAPLVDAGFQQPVAQMGMLDVWTLAFMFGFQIYFDFSGYSSIALGSSRVMGFHFPRNFNWPYLATSPRDFWRRWHISLSTWIRDYLYLPLQGVKFRGTGKGYVKGEETTASNEQASEGRRTFALFATWFIMGLWHGASWTFALWGVWHAVLVLLHRFTEPVCGKLPLIVRQVGGWLWTVPMAMLGWIYFRATSMEQANAMIVRAFDITTIRTMSLRENVYLVAAVYMIGFLIVAAGWNLNQRGKVPVWVRNIVIALAGGVMFFSVFLMLRHIQTFIYFNF
jgi:alginate O-acetyltransferase complex protein AlgI